MVSPYSILFRETQKLRQWWIWLLVVLCVAGAWLSFVVQIIYDTPFGDNPAPDAFVWALWAVFGVGFPFFFLSVRMEVSVDPGEIHLSYFPLIRRRILAAQIDKAYARTYSPLREYGGWGVRWSRRNGWAFNVSGKSGVQLELKDGRKLLIGTQEPERLLEAVETMLSGRNGKEDGERL